LQLQLDRPLAAVVVVASVGFIIFAYYLTFFQCF